MKLNVKKILFVGLYLFALLSVLIWRTPLSMQTNLDSLAKISNTDWPTDKLTNKFSNVVNIVIKSNNLNDAENVANSIKADLYSQKFKNLVIINTDFSLSNATEKLQTHKNSFLGTEYRNLLRNGEYSQITDNAVSTVFSSMAPNILSLNTDPFLLSTNYMLELKSANGKWGVRDGFLWQYNAPFHYILISVNVDTSNATNLIDDIDSLTNDVKKYNNQNTSVFLSGVPVHSANMTRTSKLQLSCFSLVALFAAILLNWLLFRRVATLLPVILSLGTGFLAGALILFLCFPQPHILAFVFGVTLIGLGIDYSLHFISAIIHKNDKNVYKNILHSFLTTIVCFIPLLFSGLSLLQQISAFTITGLTAIYLGWLIFMPQKIDAKKTSVVMPSPISHRHRKFVIGAIISAIIITLPFVRTENNMSQLYRPNSALMYAEKQMRDLSGTDTSKILIVRGETLQEALKTAEDIKDESGNFFDLSTIIPSNDRQIENQNLIRALYKSQSTKIRHELGLRTTPKFSETPLIQISDIQNDKTFADLLDKFLFVDENFVYLIANVKPDFATDNKNAIVVSPTQEMQTMMTRYSHQSCRLLAICAVALILLLIGLYGKKAMIYLFPPILAVGLTVAVLTWFNQPITFFHMLSLFIVIGLTLDYSIFHINAVDNREIKPVLFSFLTSLIGFGILGFASFFLIRSMGITLGIGLLFGYLISLFLFRRQN